jgi:hypothetical protein
MVSFEHPDQIQEAAEVCQSVVLDNGAFSAWRNKRTHNFDGYIGWAAKWLKHPAVDWCVIPDVIDGSVKENDALVYAWPLSHAYSVPVYHLHEPVGRIARLAQSFPRIALGSSGEFADVGTQRWWNRMAEIMNAICDADGMPLVKLHGLRMLDPDCFSRLPLASADSCNVVRNAGLDKKWTGPYVPTSKCTRALVMMDRIEAHASARRWSGDTSFRNWELLG